MTEPTNAPLEPLASDDGLNLELAAELITVRIRWFGLCVGYVLVNALGRETNQASLNAILTLGAVYALIDTLYSIGGRVFLAELRLLISIMEAVFIGLLCYFDTGLESPFRFYYFLSLLVCAIRHAPSVTFATFGLHSISYITLAIAVGIRGRDDWILMLLMIVFMAWVTWAITALTGLVNSAGQRLSHLNSALRDNKVELEQRIIVRTRELQESQALIVQQEKQAAFGLLAAGIAHEVGNPLASISSLVQMLNRRNLDDYTRERLSLVDEQLLRIQRTLRELVDFSRPATDAPVLSDVHEIIDTALSIAKYYKRRKGRHIETQFDETIPPLRIVRDQLVQVVLNLILNALDATEEGEWIRIETEYDRTEAPGTSEICIRICDSGHGISREHQERLFRPYFTTKDTGTGLGLFVSRRIVEQTLGGRIELTSSDTTGTTFTVRLRCDPPVAITDATTTVSTPVSPLRNGGSADGDDRQEPLPGRIPAARTREGEGE